MEQTVEHLFRYVEEKIIGLEMLLKYGKGYSKSYDQQLFKPVDFYVIDYEIYKYDTKSIKAHIGYLLGLYRALSNNDYKLNKLAELDKDALEFSTIAEVTKNLKSSLDQIILKLKEYKEIFQTRHEDSMTGKHNRLSAMFVDCLLKREINGEPIFSFDSIEDRKQLKESIIFFINGDLDSISPILNLQTPNKKEYYAYYVISRVAESSGIHYSSIKNISINGKPYDEKSGSRHRSKYNKKIANQQLTPDFKEFYSSFEDEIKEHLG